MSIEHYLAPINPDIFGFHPTETAVTLGSHIDTYFDTFPGIPESGIVLLGVGEDRGDDVVILSHSSNDLITAKFQTVIRLLKKNTDNV